MRLLTLLLLLWCFAMNSQAADIDAEHEVILLEASLGTVKFTHQAHAGLEDMSCNHCHHTLKKNQQPKPCRDCHQKTSSASVPDSKTAFHTNCIACHKEKQASKQATGPVDNCTDCHLRK
jgi:hypothetical protein